MTHEFAASDSRAGSLGPRRVKTSDAMPRSLKAAHTSLTYTLSPPFALWPSEAVGDVCMEMTATRRGARLRINSRFSATICRSRVKPRSEEHTSELQSQSNLVCRLLL